MPRRIPNLDLPILQDLYKPDFDPSLLKIIDSVPISEDELQRVEEKVKEVEAKLFSGDVPQPLTKEEAAAIEEEVLRLRDAIAETRRRISSTRARIDAQAAPDGQAEISFAVDLKKKGRLRRAVRRAFGTKPQKLTYSMYKAALEAKVLLEKAEADGYVAGEWEAEED